LSWIFLIKSQIFITFNGGEELMTKDDKERYNANALVRGLEILKLFGEDRPTLSLVEISKELNVSRTVPYRLLFTLQSLGYLAQDEATKRYSLTPK
jgi:IclR family transcriptional regulator, pca regulon regulatory protein